MARRIEALGLDVSHFKYGRPATPHAIRKTPSQILVRLPEGASRARPYQLRRALIESGRDYRCAECGLNAEWHGKPLVLQVEHLDGDWLNCLIENL